MAATDWSWGALIFDFENNGLKDIFVANGIYQDLTNQDFLKFVTEENKFSLTQSSTPLVRCGAACCCKIVSRINRVWIISPLHQRNALVEPVHERRCQETKGQINKHRHRHHLDGLPRLVQNSPRKHIHKIGIADGDAQRRILGQAQRFAVQWRHDHP